MSLLIIDGLNVLYDDVGHRRATLASVLQSYAYRPEVTIWVWEGMNSKKIRKDIYPQYKLEREKRNIETPNREYMYDSVRLFQEMLTHTKCFQISVDGYEGDDVIATLCKNYPDTKKYIQSTDKDFLQLLDENTTGFMSPTLINAEVLPLKYIRIYKTVVGDKSDSIHGVPSIGGIKFSRLPLDELLEAFEVGDLNWVKRILNENSTPYLKLWLEENMSKVEAMWKITGFFYPSPEEINSNMIKGIVNEEELSKLVNQYLTPSWGGN